MLQATVGHQARPTGQLFPSFPPHLHPKEAPLVTLSLHPGLNSNLEAVTLVTQRS